MKIIIIGSGIAGLTAGAYLAREGYKVIIYEQFPEIGGGHCYNK
ncbi:Thiamine thiazole synthase [subsurface metagenome]